MDSRNHPFSTGGVPPQTGTPERALLRMFPRQQPLQRQPQRQPQQQQQQQQQQQLRQSQSQPSQPSQSQPRSGMAGQAASRTAQGTALSSSRKQTLPPPRVINPVRRKNRRLLPASKPKTTAATATATAAAAAATKTTTTTTTTTKTSMGSKPKPGSKKEASASSTPSSSATTFPRTLYSMLEEGKHSEIFGWSRDGKAFYINQDHPDIDRVLHSYFKIKKYSLWYRQLNIHGWMKQQRGKNQNMMLNPHFHHKMTDSDFEAILRLKSAALDMQKNNKKRGDQAKTKAKKAGATVAKKKTSKTKKTVTSKAGKTKLRAASASAKKTAKKAPPSSSASSVKTRKKKTADEAEEKASADAKQKAQDNRIKRKLLEHKKLYRLFQQWEMFHLPPGLARALETGKVGYSAKKQCKTAIADAADAEPETDEDCAGTTQEQIDALLLCREDLPESLGGCSGNKGDGSSDGDESRLLAEFVERVRKDKARRDELEEIWSSLVVPDFEGKAPSPQKSTESSDTTGWENVTVGDRLALFAGTSENDNRNNGNDTSTLYTAIVREHRPETSHFRLQCEDDGADVWLDLKLEHFRLVAENLWKNKRTRSNPPMQHSEPKPTSGTPSRTITNDRLPNKEPKESSASSPSPSPPRFALPDSHSHLEPFVRYSWRGLELGSKVGTPLYNDFIRCRDASAPEATTLDLLNDVRSLRRHGLQGVPCSDAVLPEAANATTTTTTTDRTQGALAAQLASLRDDVSRTRAAAKTASEDPKLEAVRRLTETWSIPAVRKHLRTMETQILKLNEREETILEKFRTKGLC